MALDWSNERYVRLYTRITPDMEIWCYQAKAIWPWLMGIADRAGVIAAKRGGLRGLAKSLDMPIEFVTAGMNGTADGVGLLEDGCIVEAPDGYVIRNYVDAQTAVASVNKRVADHRARQRLGTSLDERSAANSDVTRANEPSEPVTPVTPSGTDPSGTERDRTDEERAPASPSAAPLTLEPTGKKARRRREALPRTPMPEDYEPRDSHREKADRLGLDLAAELARFRTSTAKRGCLWADWHAAFHDWLDNAPEFNRARAGPIASGTRDHRPVTGLAATAELLREMGVLDDPS